MAIQTVVSNLQTVQHLYESFGMGDIPAILDQLTEDAVWDHYGNPAIVPFAGAFHGKAEILSFFQKLGQSTRFESFTPENFREKGNQVINDVRMEGEALPTGKMFKATVTFYWTFNEKGKVAHWKNEGGQDAVEAAFAH